MRSLPSIARAVARRLVRQRPEYWAQVRANEAIRDAIVQIGPSGLDAIEISGDKYANSGFRSYKSANYPDYDVCEGPLDEACTDVVIAAHVWEHLNYPLRAARNVHAMLRPGGHFLMVTPFMFRVHPHPLDCSRWTEQGLFYLLEEAGFDPGKIRTGSWGNRACVKSYIDRDTRYIPAIHSLRNEEKFPINVWAFAQK